MSETDIDRTLRKILLKLRADLRSKGRGAFVSSHEIYGILAEELNVELLDAIHANDPQQIQKELIDVAVGALFALASYEAGGVSK